MIQKIVTYIRSLPLLYSVGGGLVLLAAVVTVVHFATRPAPTADVATQVPHVTLASIASLASSGEPLSLVGNVTSLNQATLLAQASGGLVSLPRQLGDYVSTGSIIGELENSSQQAAVLQAQGSYDAAVASLAKVSGSTATNAGITSGQASQSAANSAAALATSLQSTYSALDDAVHSKADTMFSNPRTITPTFNLNVSNSQLVVTLQNERSQLDATVADAQRIASDISVADLDANAAAMTSDAQTIITFLNNLVQATNQAQTSQSVSATTLAGYQTTAGAARSEVLASISTLASQKSAYDAAAAGAQTAANTAGGGSQNDIAAATAQVKQAQGALDAAEASLEKTIIRSPIAGTIVSLPVTLGSFISAGSEVAEVSNPSALQVTTYVTPDDAKTLALNAAVTIEDNVAGIITSIAPALDPTTNKIQVKIGITASQASLTDGETVSVLLTRHSAPASSTTTAGPITVPIAAVKILPEGAVVLTVTGSSTLSSLPITLGTILGDQVTVLTGLTPSTVIVTDARGLSSGETVIVDDK